MLISRLYWSAYLAYHLHGQARYPFLPMERILADQARRVRATVAYAYRYVPYYRETMDRLGLRPGDFRTAADLARLPLLDDAFLRENLDQLTSVRCPHGARETVYTSGSHSGIPTAIYWDRASMLHKLAYAERDRAVLNQLMGQGWGQRQLYILTPTSTSLDVRAYWDAHLLIPRGLARRHYVSPMQPFEAVAGQINAIKPGVIFTYGSYADAFVRFLRDRHVTLVPPRVWVYGGDMLSPGGRELLQETVGCRVLSNYAAAEAGRLGFQCGYGQGFHMNIDLVAVRLIDAQGNTVPPGEGGEVVISNLHNRATVLLNYRLGDLAVMGAAPCPCGRSLPLLDHLEGKQAEAIYLPDGYSLSVFQIETHCKVELKLTRAAQLHQPTSQDLVWRIVPFADVDREALRAALREKTHSFLKGSLEVAVEFVAEIPLTGGAKFVRAIPCGRGQEPA